MTALLSGSGSDSLKSGILASIGSVDGDDLGKDAYHPIFRARRRIENGSLQPNRKTAQLDARISQGHGQWENHSGRTRTGQHRPASHPPGPQHLPRRLPALRPHRAGKCREGRAHRQPSPRSGKRWRPYKGKILFGACVVCHKLGGEGAAVGPALDGIGSHGAAELLGQIIDPNRVLEPNYAAHNITTKGGETFVGVISTENDSTLTLATQAGVKEISKSDIAKRENTKRSLMPEGFEALGAAGLRDLLAFIIAQAGPAPGEQANAATAPKTPAPILNRRKWPDPIPATPVDWEKGKTSVLIISGGSSHKFHEFFGKTDSKTLEDAGLTVHYTEDVAQATKELANADVAIISVNRAGFDTPEYRKALMDRIAAGKGVIMHHPGTWYGYKVWPDLNLNVVGGGTRGHDKLGPMGVRVVNKRHPIMRGVSPEFELVDELYMMNRDGPPEGAAKIRVLAETSVSAKSRARHPAVWITEHPKSSHCGIHSGPRRTRPRPSGLP